MSDTQPLADRHVLITGAGGGIGSAIARRLSAAGAAITLAGRNRGRLEAAAAELGAGRFHIADGFDVRDRTAVERGFESARSAFGPVSILINNAGEAPSASFENTTDAMWSDTIGVNLDGAFIVTQAAMQDLRSQGGLGRIINIASTAGLTGYRYVSAYTAAKHGLIGLTRALALELARSGITVNAVCPGFTDTDLVARAVEKIAQKTGRTADLARDELIASNPQGRLVRPEEVADAVHWLALPAASAITGQAIVVAGGEIMAG